MNLCGRWVTATGCLLGLVLAADATAGTIDFDIDGGSVVPTETYAAKVEVLGAAIVAGSYDMPVTVKVKIGGESLTPWGSFGKPLSGNVNDDQNPREHITPDVLDADVAISVRGRSWIKKSSNYSGNKNKHWKEYMQVRSDENSPQVKVLRDGDPVPNIEGYAGQEDVEDFVGDYIDAETGYITLGVNQAIYLFELGTTNLNSAAADFQDLVVLVTLAKTPQEFELEDDLALALYD